MHSDTQYNHENDIEVFGPQQDAWPNTNTTTLIFNRLVNKSPHSLEVRPGLVC